MGEPTLSVGLVGAGPWASFVHAPMLAGHRRTRLDGVWARRPEAAEALAAEHGTSAAPSFEALLDRVEAVAFAVPPDVQAVLARTAAAAGKALLLEKPIALELDAAQRLVAEVDRAGVATQVVLTWRYSDAVRSFLRAVDGADAIGARGHFVSGALLGGPFATPWRLEHGPLLDLGPHVLDLLDAALGPIVAVQGHGDLVRWVGLLAEHESGRCSEISLSASSAVEPGRAGVEVYTPEGLIAVDASAAFGPEVLPRIVDEFADAVSGLRRQPIDVHRGLHLQRLLDAALGSMSGPRR